MNYSTPKVDIVLNKEDINVHRAFFTGTITIATNEQIRVEMTQTKLQKVVAYVFMVFFFICGVILSAVSLYGVITNVFDNVLLSFFFIIIAILPFVMIIWMYKSVKASEKHFVVFDRQTGNITFPVGLFSAEFITYPFLDTEINVYEYNGIILSGIKVGRKKFPVFEVRIGDEDKLEKYWQYINFYMDKNLPLPVGTAFDEYR